MMPRVNLGSVSKDRVEQAKTMLRALGNSGRIMVGPDDGPKECCIDLGSVTVKFKAPYTVDYEFDGDLCRLTFADQLTVQWLFAQINVSEISIDTNEVLIHAGLFQAKMAIE